MMICEIEFVETVIHVKLYGSGKQEESNSIDSNSVYFEGPPTLKSITEKKAISMQHCCLISNLVATRDRALRFFLGK